MSDYAQPATIAATAIVSIAIGFGAATWIALPRPDSSPIINPTAWEETAPAPQAQTVSLTNAATPGRVAARPANCSPWEITDVAMEEVLDEMIDRGWRPPNQGQAIAAMGVSGIRATDPFAPMPYGRSWSSAASDDAVISEEPVHGDALPVEATPPATPAPSAPTGAAPQPVAIDQPQPVAARPEG